MKVIRYLREKIQHIRKRFAKLSPSEIEELRFIEQSFPFVESTKDTLAALRSGASICRYGDAEFDICLHKNKDDPYQKPSEKLSQRLEEILMHGSSDKLIVAIPPFNSKWNNDKNFYGKLSFWEWYWLKRYSELKHLFKHKRYGNSFVSRDCVFYENSVEQIVSLWEGRDVVFVIGKGGRFHFDPRLFGVLNSSNFVFVPPTSAFEDYDRIMNECLQFQRHSLFLIAAGPTATVLAFDLHKRGYQAIDMGHISICYQQFLGEVKSPESLPLISV